MIRQLGTIDQFNSGQKVRGINVGDQPSAIAVNPETNMIYIVNYGSNSISVIDSTYDKLIDNIKLAHKPIDISVNPKTNKIYVVQSMSQKVQSSKNVTVIDGLNNKVIDNLEKTTRRIW